jgi:hypothetical protein
LWKEKKREERIKKQWLSQNHDEKILKNPWNRKGRERFDLRIIILKKQMTEKRSWNVSSRKKGDGKKEKQMKKELSVWHSLFNKSSWHYLFKNELPDRMFLGPSGSKCLLFEAPWKSSTRKRFWKYICRILRNTSTQEWEIFWLRFWIC